MAKKQYASGVTTEFKPHTRKAPRKPNVTTKAPPPNGMKL